VACAGLLHDAVKDHAAGIAPGGRQAALAVLAGRFGARTAALVPAVTNPAWEPGRDKHEQYREHVLAALQASPWAQVIKASDFTDNAVGIIHTTGPKLPELARRYGPLVPALRVLILRPDTPLEDDVKGTIAAQLDAAHARLAAIRHDHHGAVPLLPGPAPARNRGL
jgi:hypothetical protein